MKITLIVLVGSLACLMVALWWLTRHGFSARDQPAAIEVWIARQLRHLAVPASQRSATNPIPSTPDILSAARAHFADHCAICHANNGNGQTPIGRNVFPKSPDLRAPNTQTMSDGELFYVIHNGIRFTAMPAWGKERPEDDVDSWKLVHFIRHLSGTQVCTASHGHRHRSCPKVSLVVSFFLCFMLVLSTLPLIKGPTLPSRTP